MNQIKKIHFVGIKGVGVAPLAIIAKEAGFEISGSDLAEEFITDLSLKKSGISPLVGFEEKHIADDTDLVIYTGAHGGLDNAEVKFATAKNIETWSQGEAVGKFMEGSIFGKKFFGISVAGCHGKTTTTAMLATILKVNNFDPSYCIGTSEIPSLGVSGHFGTGEHFVAEADEYATEINHDLTPKFIWQHPNLALFTNIEFDHPDVYPTLDDVRNAFLKFANNITSDGMLVACGDSEEIRKLLKEYKGNIITYGKDTGNDYCLQNFTTNGIQTTFAVFQKEKKLGEITLHVSGEHNAVNALGALVAALQLGLSFEAIKKGLAAFTGTKRRFEYVGKLVSGAFVYDDYAHHPTEIKKTLHAFRESFPDKKIICIFQPHMYSRTKMLYDEFVRSFEDADTIIITDIYPSLREAVDPSVSSEKLAMSIKNVHKSAIYLSKLSNVVKYIEENVPDKNTILITMGAGNVYKIAGELLPHPALS